ncbi:MAG: YfiR family protein [Planctomycetes bacterium]|nr:YfiR family protein [Planctomycetota bacterium]
MSKQKRQQVRAGTNRHLRVVRAILVLAATLSVCFSASAAFAAQPKEHTLKVAYLYNFTKFVSWPADALPPSQGAFVIGVIGENPFGQTLNKLAAAKLAQKRPIAVRYFKSLADYKPCHMLFVAASTPPDVRAAIIRQTRNQPVLVVGENVGYGVEGSTVNFVLLEDGSIKIEINIDAMNRRKMQANALLLKLATVVRDQGEE